MCFDEECICRHYHRLKCIQRFWILIRQLWRVCRWHLQGHVSLLSSFPKVAHSCFVIWVHADESCFARTSEFRYFWDYVDCGLFACIAVWAFLSIYFRRAFVHLYGTFLYFSLKHLTQRVCLMFWNFCARMLWGSFESLFYGNAVTVVRRHSSKMYQRVFRKRPGGNHITFWVTRRCGCDP